MKEIEDNISALVSNHFPEFYKQEGENFVEFVKEYYKWAEQSNNSAFYTRNLFEYRDIDKTIDDFLYYFKQKYLVGSPHLQENTRFTVKHALDFYRSKGTERGLKLYFQEIYSESDVEVYFPGRDILRASDGEWYVPTYLELSLSPKTASFIGKQIIGSYSGAVAFVEGVSRKVISGKYIDIVYLSSVQGNFVIDDIITVDGNLSQCPVVVGSLTRLVIDLPGRDFNVGDVVDVISERRGRQAKARVESVVNTTGRVNFTLLDGGSGYQLNTQPIVAEKTLVVANVTSSNSYITGFAVGEFIYQPLANIAFTASNTDFTYQSIVVGANSTANVAQGIVVGRSTKTVNGFVTANSSSNVVIGTNTSFNTDLANSTYIRFSGNNSTFLVSSVTNATHLTLTTTGPNVVSNTIVIANGHMLLSVTSGDFSLADRIANTSALITAYTNRTASGKIIGSNTTAVGVVNVNMVFTSNSGNYIYGSSSNVHAKVQVTGTGSGADLQIGSITDEETVYLNTDLISDNNSITTTLLTGTVTSNSTNSLVTGVGTDFTNELYDGAYIKFSGNTQTFQVNNISNSTVLYLTTNSAVVTSNSIYLSNGAFLTTPLDALKYGFPKLPNANSATLLNLALTREAFTVGTIASLSGINPGADYNISPFVQIQDELAKFDRKNLSLELSNVSGNFVVGEEITQDFSENAYSLYVSGSNTLFLIPETVTQWINATANAYGEVRTSNTSLAVVATSNTFSNTQFSPTLTGTATSNTTSIVVTGTATSFLSQVSAGDYIKFSGNTALLQVNNVISDTLLNLTSNGVNVTSNSLVVAINPVVGMSSGVAFVVNTAVSNAVISLSRGSVLVVSNNTIQVKRKTFNQSFTSGVLIQGSVSGASANVVSATQIADSLAMGNNAIVNSYAGVVAGSIGSVKVIDSGFAYEDGEPVTLSTANNPFVAQAYANLINQGVGEGYFKSTRGFLNSDKYLHDGDYYQAHSYQVKSGLPLEVYSETLKQLCHIAGTKLFGNIVKTSNVDVRMTTNGVQIEI